jgi:hypothetical protein
MTVEVVRLRGADEILGWMLCYKPVDRHGGKLRFNILYTETHSSEISGCNCWHHPNCDQRPNG